MNLLQRLILASTFAALASSSPAEPRLQMELDRGYYLEKSQNNLYLKTTLFTGDQETAAERLPANIVFLVDRSGSMEGEKLVQLKAALQNALTQLSSDDRIALLAFGSTVETILPSTPLDQLGNAPAAIQNLETDGGSDLFTGLEQARSEIAKNASEHTFDRIILICDGPPNKGPRDIDSFAERAANLAQQKISIAVFALGPEAPTDLLYRIVEASGGPLYDVADPAQLSGNLATELQTLNRAIGRDAVLEIEFQRSIDIVESIGRKAEQDPHTVVYRFDKLLANQEITTVVQATIGASDTFFSSTKIAKAKLTYQPTLLAGAPPVIIESAIETRFAQSNSQSFKSIVPHVYQTVCEGEVADTVREAVESFQQGQSKQALRELKKLSRNIRSVAQDIPELEVQASLDQLTKAIDMIEAASQSPIEHRALLNTLYPTPSASPQ